MDLATFCRKLPKIELHAHLNGSLSQSTMMELRRYYADTGMKDETNVFFDEFKIGAGDTRNLADCFQVFNIAHCLTTTPEALTMATTLTLKEFEEDGCCYIELRSTPRDTEFMTKKIYIETIVQAIKSSNNSSIIARLIISINRKSLIEEAKQISDLAVEFNEMYPDVVVGIELSGNPTVGKFEYFKSALTKARLAGLKVSLHCGEVVNPSEIMEMIEFQPDRIGHAVCVLPRLGGTNEIWQALQRSKIPVEICVTSNVNTKSVLDYNSHHFKEFYEAEIPLIICTDDKGVFTTSLTQEYTLCAETFGLTKSQLVDLSSNASRYVFAGEISKQLKEKVLDFAKKNDVEEIKCNGNDHVASFYRKVLPFGESE